MISPCATQVPNRNPNCSTVGRWLAHYSLRPDAMLQCAVIWQINPQPSTIYCPVWGQGGRSDDRLLCPAVRRRCLHSPLGPGTSCHAPGPPSSTRYPGDWSSKCGENLEPKNDDSLGAGTRNALPCRTLQHSLPICHRAPESANRKPEPHLLHPWHPRPRDSSLITFDGPNVRDEM